jgi:hypothetical protein
MKNFIYVWDTIYVHYLLPVSTSVPSSHMHSSECGCLVLVEELKCAADGEHI